MLRTNKKIIGVFLFFLALLLPLGFVVYWYFYQNQSVSPNSQAGTTTARPNIVLVLVDDMPPWMINVNGMADNPWIPTSNTAKEMKDSAWKDGDKEYINTPYLEELATTGVYFNKVYHTLPQCKGSRASIITGKMPFINGVVSNYESLSKDSNPNTLPKILNQFGYFTSLIGKCHLGPVPSQYEDEGQIPLTQEDIDPNYNSNLYVYDTLGFTHSEILYPDHGLEWDWYRYRTSVLNGLSGNVSESTKSTVNNIRIGLEKRTGGKYSPYEAYFTNYVTDRAIEVIKNKDNMRGGKPFFVEVSYLAPHRPHNYRNLPPADLYGLTDRHNPDVKRVVSGSGMLNEGFAKQSAQKVGIIPDPNVIPLRNRDLYQDVDFSKLPPQISNSSPYYRFGVEFNSFLTPEGIFKAREQLMVAYRMMNNVDANIGKIVTALKETNQYDNTIIIFMSDNGFIFGEHRLASKGPVFFDEITRTPLIISYPAKQNGTSPEWRVGKSPALLSTLDLPATLLEVIGLQKSAEMQGTSFKRVLEGRATFSRHAALIEYAAEAQKPYPMRGIVNTAGYKFIHYLASTVGGTAFNTTLKNATYNGAQFQLYDLKNDPFELNNLLPYQAGDSFNNNAVFRLLRSSNSDLKTNLINILKQLAVEQTKLQDPSRVIISDVSIAASRTGLTASWNTNNEATTQISVYETSCRTVSCQHNKNNFDLSKSHTLIVSELEPDSRYLVKLYSINGNAQGGYHEQVITTKP